MAIDITSPVQLPVKRKPGLDTASDKPKRPRISAKMIEAIELMAEQPRLMQKDAAVMVGLRPEHLCRYLKKDHVQDYLTRAAKRKVSSAVYRAAHVKVDLLESDSDKVRNDVASDILAIGGIAPPRDGKSTNVNVQVQAGYIVNWRGTDDASKPAIDVTPEPAD